MFIRARQGVIHGALLIIGCALMPIMPSEAWRPTDAGDPTVQILLLLAANIGLPALLLCSTSPLMHVWYMRRTGADVPYWLFALSNFGSMLALLSFPFLLEPAFDSRTLAIGWSALFLVYAALCIYLAWMSRTGAPLHESPLSAQAQRAPSFRQMALWVLLSACASAMLVSDLGSPQHERRADSAVVGRAARFVSAHLHPELQQPSLL